MNKVAQVNRFDETVAPQGSYLNDVRFSPDGRHAYLTDAGAEGALVGVDLQNGTARRVLHGCRVEPGPPRGCERHRFGDMLVPRPGASQLRTFGFRTGHRLDVSVGRPG
jgi:hypothetical protein